MARATRAPTRPPMISGLRVFKVLPMRKAVAAMRRKVMRAKPVVKDLARDLVFLARCLPREA